MTLVLRLVYVFRGIYRDPITGCEQKLLIKTTDDDIQPNSEYQCANMVTFGRCVIKGELLRDLQHIATERCEEEIVTPLLPSL
jgi:hypothetical protein